MQSRAAMARMSFRDIEVPAPDRCHSASGRPGPSKNSTPALLRRCAGQKLAYVYFEDEPGEDQSQIAHPRRGAADCRERGEVTEAGAQDLIC